MVSTIETRPKKKTHGLLLALPGIFWLVFFFMLPLIIILALSIMTPSRGGIGGAVPLTLDNYDDAFGGVYFRVIEQSLITALTTTVICLIIGYPLAFFIATQKRPFMKQMGLFLVILPFWTNFLVRTYAMRTILGQQGPINAVLLNLGLIDEPVRMLNTQYAVIAGLVYGFLPFMVLPIYATVEKFNFSLVEAAHDLGANDWHAFRRVILPLTLPGVVAGVLLVFIPSIGAFVTPDLLGGTDGFMLGNLIQRQFRGSGGNWPRGSAISIVMMVLVSASVFIYLRWGERED